MSIPLIEVLKKAAKDILEICGTLTPMIFFIKGEKIEKIFPLYEAAKGYRDHINNEDDLKNLSLTTVGLAAKTLDMEKVVVIHDAAFRQIKPEDIKKYDATEKATLYPKSMRTECIVICEIELKSAKSEIYVLPYKGGEGEPVEFLEEMRPDSHESRFIDYVMKGYNMKLPLPKSKE